MDPIGAGSGTPRQHQVMWQAHAPAVIQAMQISPKLAHAYLPRIASRPVAIITSSSSSPLRLGSCLRTLNVEHFSLPAFKVFVSPSPPSVSLRGTRGGTMSAFQLRRPCNHRHFLIDRLTTLSFRDARPLGRNGTDSYSCAPCFGATPLKLSIAEGNAPPQCAGVKREAFSTWHCTCMSSLLPARPAEAAGPWLSTPRTPCSAADGKSSVTTGWRSDGSDGPGAETLEPSVTCASSFRAR